MVLGKNWKINEGITNKTLHHPQVYDRILAISSREGETVELERSVTAEGNVEVWLNALLKESQRSLHLVIRQATQTIQEPGLQIIDFLNSFPAQVISSSTCSSWETKDTGITECPFINAS